jgi:hypothetical protein
MDEPTVRERLAAFMAECAIGEGDEAARIERGFRDHLAGLPVAALSDRAAAHWRGVVLEHFGVEPGATEALRAAAAIGAWPGERREQLLTDIGYLAAFDDPDIHGLNEPG